MHGHALGRSKRKTARLRVLVASPGLGQVRRGYEAFAAEFAAQLDALPDMQVLLLQGWGARELPGAVRIPKLGRYGPLAAFFGRRAGLYPSTVEHFSFGIFSLVALARFRPHVIVTAERPLANFYGWVSRRFQAMNYRVLLRNGGHQRPPYKWLDHVLHHTQAFRDEAAGLDENPGRHSCIPYGFNLGAEAPTQHRDAEARRRALRDLSLPVTHPILLTVGIVDKDIKRMDYLINEVARIRPDIRPYLVMLGEHCPQTPAVKSLAEQRLGVDGYCIRSVGRDCVRRYYESADLFALASPREGFGRVFVEALDAGLPAFVHDSPHMRSVLGDFGYYVDMRRAGELQSALEGMLSKWPDDLRSIEDKLVAARHNFVYERYSWTVLIPQYRELLYQVAHESHS